MQKRDHQDRTDKYPDDLVPLSSQYRELPYRRPLTSTKVYDYHCPKNYGSDKTKYTTTVDRGFIKFLPETNMYHYFHYRRENAYFRYELDPFRKGMLRRYNPEMTTLGLYA